MRNKIKKALTGTNIYYVPDVGNYELWRTLSTNRKNQVRSAQARNYLSRPTPINLFRAAKAYFGGYDPRNPYILTTVPPSLLPTPVTDWRNARIIGQAAQEIKDYRLADYLVGMADDIAEEAPSFAKFVRRDPEAAEKAWNKLRERDWMLRNWRDIPDYLDDWARKLLETISVTNPYATDYGKGLILYSSPSKPVDYMDRSIKAKPMSDRQWGGGNPDNGWGTYIDRIVEGLKKGGNIHIKKANRGKFTEYCGGKVTSECIAKGKNSSDPAVRKRATFAANARKWKHNFGGLLKAEEGTKFDWGGLAKSVGSDIMSIVSANKKANAHQDQMNANLDLSYQQALLNLLNKALELKNSAFNLWMLQYQSGLTQDNPSQIVLAHQFNPDVSLLKNEYNNKKMMVKSEAQQYRNDLLAENISDIGNTIAGSISNYYANKNTTPTIAPTGSVDTTFTKIKTPKITYNPNMMNLSLT